MATRTATVTGITTGGLVVEWTGLTFATTDNGNGVSLPFAEPMSVQITGVFGAGGSVSLRGTNGATIDTTNDPVLQSGDGTPAALTFTAAGIQSVHERTRMVYPIVTAGDGDTLLACRIVVAVATEATFTTQR